jgi:hypothetical protein
MPEDYQKFYCINSCILDASNPHEGYVSKDGRFAAIRVIQSKKYMIIVDGKQDKLCRNWDSAMTYIKKLESASKKSKSKGTLNI